MHISSRTPEGIPNRCPVCGKSVVIEPSDPAGDAPCSHCGHLLWFMDEEANEVLMVKLDAGQGRQDLFESMDPGDAEILRLSEQLSQENITAHLTLDFSRIGSLSTAALGKLITLDKKVKKRGGKLKLRNVRPETYTLFAITRLDRLFDIETA